MGLIPEEIKTQIKEAATMGRAAMIESARHNKVIETQNAEIIILLTQIRDKQ